MSMPIRDRARHPASARAATRRDDATPPAHLVDLLGGLHPRANEADWVAAAQALEQEIARLDPDSPLGPVTVYVTPCPVPDDPSPTRWSRQQPARYQIEASWHRVLGTERDWSWQATLRADATSATFRVGLSDRTTRDIWTPAPFWSPGHLDRTCFATLVRGLRASLISAQAHLLVKAGLPEDQAQAAAERLIDPQAAPEVTTGMAAEVERPATVPTRMVSPHT